MIKSRSGFFKIETGKCKEELNKPNNFEVFSELIIQVLSCGEKFIYIFLTVVME